MLFYSVSYTFIDVLGTYTTYRLLKVFYDGKEKNKALEISSYVVFHIVLDILYLTIRIPVLLFISNLLFIFFITFNYNVAMKERVFPPVLTCFVQTLVEILVAVLSGNYGSIIEQTELQTMLTHINTRIIGFIVILLLGKMPHSRTMNKRERIGGFMALTIPLSVMYLYILFQPNAVSKQELVFSIAVLFCMYITAFYVYNSFLAYESQKKKLLEQQNSNYLLQYKIVVEHSKESKKLRHDMQNHAIVLKYLSRYSPEELINYIDRELLEGMKIREHIDSGNIVIDSILNGKMFEAESYGIQLKLNMTIPEALTVDSIALAAIFSNLLDYAIAETRMNSREDKVIEVILTYNKGLFLIQIIHDEDGEMEELSKKYAKRNRKGYNIENLNDEDIIRAVKNFSGGFEFSLQDKRVEAFVMLHIPLDVWIK